MADELLEQLQTTVTALRSSVDEFTGKYDGLLNENIERLQNKIDELEAKLAGRKTGIPSTADEQNAELRKTQAKVFTKFVRNGIDPITPEERKGLIVSDDDAGGYTVPEDWRAEIMRGLKDTAKMRGVCRVVSTTRDRIIVPKLLGAMNWTWTDEVTLPSEVNVANMFGQLAIGVHNASGLVLASQNILEDSAFNIEGFIADELKDSLGMTEDDMFLGGSGAGQPEGLLTNLPTGCFVDTATATAIVTDDMINLIYGLEGKYAVRAQLMCRRPFIRELRKCKSAVDGQYLWQPSLQIGEPSTFDGIPIVQPTSTKLETTLSAGKLVCICGDFNYYWIVDRVQMSMQRLNEKYIPNVGFYFRVRRGGKRMLDEPFKVLRMKPA